MTQDAFTFLATRQSYPSKAMQGPAPDRAALEPILRAALNNDPAQRAAFHDQIDAVGAARGVQVQPLAGADLYPRIRAAHTIVATSEGALFGNVILRKGVVRAATP